MPALTLTVARAFDTDNGSMIRIESFTPLALPLYAVLLVLLAVAAALWQRATGSPGSVAAVLALVGLGDARLVVRAAGRRRQPRARRRTRTGSR